ncbi:MAG: hypothetical protein EOP05_05380 [Proteobacteria bacterium]|nr:MAG: hypothetical protein EOP05_05380 [Pseudomonadota bacterium]
MKFNLRFKMRLNSKLVVSSALVTLLSLMGFSPNAHAYDEDTHFYGTYAMARYAGIRHEVATQIALSAQWMDESYISDPTSMIFLPITGIKKRRLLHFPSSRIVGSLASDTQMKMMGLNEMTDVQKQIAEEIAKRFDVDNKLTSLTFMTETMEDHPFASELLMEGLKRGNLMMASAAIHTIEDSYAHAGTPAEMGHAAFWHWPDRPFSSPEKYNRMEHGVFGALVAIRTMLPAEAIDCELSLAPIPSQVPNCQMDAKLLADNYAATSAVTEVISTDILKDPEYVAVAINDILVRGVKAKYLNLNTSQIRTIIASLPKTSERDAYDSLELLMRNLVKKEINSGPGIVNMKYILADMGRLRPNASDREVINYAKSFGTNDLLRRLSEELLLWKVPAPLSDTHRMEVEDDKSPIRAKEMELRIRNMQKLIVNLFNQKIQMIPNPTKDDVGFAREVLMDRTAESKIPVDKETAYVTFNLRERNAWDKMIFSYLFPSFKGEELKLVVQQAAKLTLLAGRITEYKEKREAITNDKRYNYASRKARLAKLDWDYKVVSSTAKILITGWKELEPLLPYLPTFVKDTVETHITPSPDNFYYRSPELFAAYIQNGVVKPLLTRNDVWTHSLLKEKSRMQAGRAPEPVLITK